MKICASFVLVSLCCGSVAAQRTVKDRNIEWSGNSSGLTVLKYKGMNVLGNGGLRPHGQITLTKGNGQESKVNWGKATGTKLSGSTIETTWEWGGVTATTYSVADDTLTIDIKVTNRSRKTVKSLYLSPFTVKFPGAPNGWDPHFSFLRSNVGSPSYVVAWCGEHNVIAYNKDVTRPLLSGYIYSENRKPAGDRQFIVGTGGKGHLGGRWDNLINRPIGPGDSDTFTVCFRFAPASESVDDILAPLFSQFAERVPAILDWEDRRPIGAVFLGRDNTQWPKNPRGWFNDEAVDVTTDGGRQQFRERLLRLADSTVTNLKKMNAQGVVIWDIEGDEHPHPITYIGDPRRLSPEMETVVDEFFKRFSDAGFRTGICIRPQLLKEKPGGSLQQSETENPSQVLMDKIKFAKERWGTTLFYVDSNGDPNAPLSPDVFRKVATAHPDVLLMPENETSGYYAVSAPYGDYKAGDGGGVSSLIKRMYPTAFRAIYAADANIEEHRDRLVSAIKDGNILLFRAWFDDPQNSKLLQMYDEASR